MAFSTKIYSLILHSVLFVGLTSCATILRGSSQSIAINSNVDGASISLNGAPLGKTPFVGVVPRSKNNVLRISKSGYKTRTVILNTQVESVFWVNLLSGGPLGSTTDYASGSMWQIAPSTYNVDLAPSGN